MHAGPGACLVRRGGIGHGGTGHGGAGLATRRDWHARRVSRRGKPRYDPVMQPATAPTIQLFGLADSRATRAALRFFKERRVVVTVVDLRRRPIAPGELRRFVERFGARALVDEETKAWRDAGLGYLRMDDAELAERLLADVRLLRLPLVRRGNEVTAGSAEATWKAWLAPRAAATAATSGASSRSAAGAATSSRATGRAGMPSPPATDPPSRAPSGARPTQNP